MAQPTDPSGRRGDGQGDEAAGGQLPGGDGGGGAGDPVERRQPQPRGQVQERGQRGHSARQRARDQAPGHHQARQGARRQVGRDPDEGHPAEHDGDDRRHGELSGEGHPHRPAQRRRPRDRSSEPLGGDDDPRRRRHGEHEADGVDEQGVDEHEPGDGERQEAHPPRLDAPGGGRRRQPGHQRGPQHRGLGPGEQGEEAQEDQEQGQPRPGPETAQRRLGHDQQEGDVLARHRHQVAQPGASEVVDGRRREGPVVAVEDPGEQRGPVRSQPHRPALDEAAEAVGGPHRPGPSVPGGHAVEHQGPGDVADRQIGSALRHDPTADDQSFPRQCARQDVGARALGSRPRLQPSAVEVDQRLHPASVDLGIGDQAHRGVRDGGRVRRAQAGPRPMPEGRGQEQTAEDEERGATPEPAEEGDDHRRDQRHRRTPVRTGHDREGDDDRGAIAHAGPIGIAGLGTVAA